jgi:hypothetical protein
MKKLYKFHWGCGRQGDVEGIFIADDETIKNRIGSDVRFGEILGKHSEVYGTLDEDDLKVVSEDQEFIEKCEEIFENKTLSGYNPLHYIIEYCDECGERAEECECICEKCSKEKWECECEEE